MSTTYFYSSATYLYHTIFYLYHTIFYGELLLDFLKQGNLRNSSNLRNCTKLSKLLLGNGELASLAFVSFKLLYEI
jgi:hypothetical protein